MKARSHPQDEQHLTEQLGATGFRLTPQRQQVYDVLLHKRDHPTAEEVFIRAKKTDAGDFPRDGLQLPRRAGKMRVWPGRSAGSRRDALLPEHARAWPFSLRCLRRRFLTWICPRKPMTLPKGFKAEHFDIAIHGICAGLRQKK